MTIATTRSVPALVLSLSLIAATIAGCATDPDAGSNAWCQTNQPMRPTAAEYGAFSLARKIEMDSHNSFGTKWCGWSPKGGY
ncbi:outer membrane lipoprotein SlyB [Amorphus orientalis]|uniref:Outer membrane lipoprotein SlyB n=1 Tax=Amorphus orientalis TaxID=649198 RepID=A0AAE3VS30_9HYPH|nr:outer membrane lipoprotein SlyB [Amorphus orientalis]